MARSFKNALAVQALVVLAGCATITRGTTDVLVIETEPPGAEAVLSNGLRCNTPCSLTVKRNASLVVDIVKEGYEPVRATVTPRISGGGAAGMAGNVIVGGLIGAAIDAGSGAMYDLVPNPLRVTLVPIEERSEAQGARGADPTASSPAPAAPETR